MKGITIRLKEEDYQALLKIAQEKGTTVYGLIKSVLKSLISGAGEEARAGPQAGLQPSPQVQEVLSKVLDRVSELANAVSQLTRRIEQLEERVGRLEGAPPKKEQEEQREEQKVAKPAPSKIRFFEEEEKVKKPEKPEEFKEFKESRLKPRFFKEKPYKTLTKSWIVKFTSAHNVKKFVEEWEGKGWEVVDMQDYITLLDPSRKDEAVEEVLKVVSEMKVGSREDVEKKVGELMKEGRDEWRILGTLLALNKLGLVYYDGSSWRRAEERAEEKERTASSNATGAASTMSATSAVEVKEAIEKGTIGEVEPIKTIETMKTAEAAEVAEAKEMMEKTTDVMVSIWRFKKLEEELKGRLFKSSSKEEIAERGYEKVEDLKSDLAGIGWTSYDLSSFEWKSFYEYSGDLLKSDVKNFLVAVNREDRRKVAKTIASLLNERGVKSIDSLVAQSLESLKKGDDERDLLLTALVLKEHGEIYLPKPGEWKPA
jgi:hypothetical protein